MRDYMDRRVTPPRRVTSPIWGTPPPCKQALSRAMFFFSTGTRIALRRPKMPRTRYKPKIETRNSPLFLRTTFFIFWSDSYTNTSWGRSVENTSRKHSLDLSAVFLQLWMYESGKRLGILGRGVPPGSPNPDPISDQKMSFFPPVFRPDL